MVWVLAVLTLGVGSIGALLQVDLKRLLAYSSIAHAGYMLMALEAGTPKGREAALFYLFVYTFMVDRLVRGRHGAQHAGRRRPLDRRPTRPRRHADP